MYLVYLVQDWAARSGDAARPAHSATPVRQHNLCITGRLFDSIVVTNSPPPLRCCNATRPESSGAQRATCRSGGVGSPGRESTVVGRGTVCGSAGRNVSREPRHCRAALESYAATHPHQSIPGASTPNTRSTQRNGLSELNRLKQYWIFQLLL